MADRDVLLSQWKIIDLTWPFAPGFPVWPKDPPFEVKAWASYEKDRYFINRISIGEHSGTHWGTPNTLIQGARSAEMFKAEELVIPAVVVDIRSATSRDINYRLTLNDIKIWEQENGKIPSASMVVLFTGWQDKWGNSKDFLGQDADKALHWPGFDADTVAFLIQERRIKGIGTDTHGVDPGANEGLCASFSIYRNGGIVLECLANLDKLPALGATLVIGGWPIKGGSGSPARVFAFLPPAI